MGISELGRASVFGDLILLSETILNVIFIIRFRANDYNISVITSRYNYPKWKSDLYPCLGKNKTFLEVSHFFFSCLLISHTPIPTPVIGKVKWSEVAQSCPTLSDPMDCSLPGSSIPGIFQAKYWRGEEGGQNSFQSSYCCKKLEPYFTQFLKNLWWTF